MSDPILKNTTSPWRSPPELIQLRHNEVHVWRAGLERPSSQTQAFWPTLSQEEQQRAHHFKIPIHRTHFIVARGLLRAILSRYLLTEPHQLQIRLSPHGKPYLSTLSHEESLSLNLTHSKGLALYAISRGREVGVDLEADRPPNFDYNRIIKRILTAHEAVLFNTLSPAEQRQAFFACWTRKEAYSKARGKGLSFPLKHITVSFLHGEPVALVDVQGDPGETGRWSICELSCGPGYTAALVAAQPQWELCCWEW